MDRWLSCALESGTVECNECMSWCVCKRLGVGGWWKEVSLRNRWEAASNLYTAG